MNKEPVINKGRIKIGIFAYSLLAMGAIGLNSVLSDMAEYFHVSDTTIALMVSIPCIVIIVVTLFLGKILEHISQKRVGLFGAVCFLVGGLLPLVLDNLVLIFICRAVTGIGIAISQVFMASLNAEFFEEEERPPVQGLASAAQTAGMIIMCLCSGFLATISWRACFLVHLVGFFGLFAMIFCIPDRKPGQKRKPDKSVEHSTGQDAILTGEQAAIRPAELSAVHQAEHKEKARLNIRTFGWFLLMFVIFLALLVYANNLSFLLVEKGIGTAADTGLALSIYAFGGLVTGLIYGKIDRFLGAAKLPLSMVLFAAMYFITNIAQSMPVIYIGGFIGGIGLSLFFPQIILYTGLSVDPSLIPVAVSLLTCSQNLGQILCPYAFNPLAALLSNEANVQQIKMYLAMGAFLILAVILVIYVIRRKRRERLASNI